MKKALRIFIGLLWQYKFRLFLYLLVVITWSISSSIQPYFYKLFIDQLAQTKFDQIYNTLLVFSAVGLGSVITGQLAYLVGDWLIIPLFSDLRVKIFKQIQDLDFAFHINKSTGSLISAIKRGQNSLWELYFEAKHILKTIIGFAVILGFFTQLNITYLIILVGCTLLFLVLGPIFIKLNITARRIFNKEADKLTGITTDNLINFETVKLFAKEDWEINRLIEKIKVFKEKLWGFSMTYRYFGTTMGTVSLASLVITILVGIKDVKNKNLTPGEFIMVIGFVRSFFSQLDQLIFRIRNIIKSKTDMEKYFDVLNQETKIKDPKKPLELNSVRGEIAFEGVGFSYPEGKKDALTDFNLKIKSGQSIALVGESGAGKTTVTKLLLRYYDPDYGKISLDGREISKFRKSDLRNHIGVVPQEPILFNQSIGYNIGYGKENATDQEIQAAAKMALLHKFILTLPKKYDTKVGERGIKLSGGQKQRLAIARMILSNPEVIVFDEATSQLDSESEQKIQQAFWKAAKNKTTIIIAHRLSTITQADKIAVMEGGEIIEQGSHLELVKNKKSKYYQFWKLQTK